MGQQKTRSPELLELCERLSQWREQNNGGGRGSQIPEELWQEALGVVQHDGLYATAQAARLNYARLKERSRAAAREQRPEATGRDNSGAQAVRTTRRKNKALAVGVGGAGPRVPAPAAVAAGAGFIALKIAPLSPATSHATLELVGSGGERMRVELAGALDVVGLAQAFWSRR